MTILRRPVKGLADPNQLTRDRETFNTILSHQFDDWRKPTKAEKLARVTVINAAYPPSDVRRYGAKGDGVTDDTFAIQQAIAVAQINSIGGYVHIPGGIYKVTSTLTVSADRIHIFGDGIDATRLLFAPTADDVLLEFNNGATSVWQCSLSDLTLYSNDSTYTKTALDLWDVRTFICERVWIGGSVAIGGSAYWGGNSASIGVRTHGREFGTFRDMLIAADRCIVVSVNPNDERDSDHFHFQNLFLIGNANPIMEIETGLNISNLTIDGHQSWNLGTHGLYWVDSTAPDVSSYAINIENVRTEQGTSSSAYSFNIESHSSSHVKGIIFKNCYLDSSRNGIRLRRCDRVTFDGVEYPAATGTAADITFISETHLITRNCLFNTGSTVTLTNAREIIGTPNSPSQNAFANGQYGYDQNTARNLTFCGAFGETKFTLADSAVQTLGTTSMLGMLTVVVTTSDNCFARFNIRGTNNVTAELEDPQGFFSAASGTASSTNVYWNSGSSRYELENKRGGSRTYRIFFVGVHS